MDYIECLKTLTENIIKKQNDSLESIKKLSRKTDMISSDISNLINSLQMVGNGQFAENRVQEEEEEASSEQQQSLIFRQQQQFDEIYTTGCSQAQASSGNKLSSILLRAIELIPPRSIDLDYLQSDSEEKQPDKNQSTHEDSSEQEEEEEELDQQLEHNEHQLRLPPPYEQVDAPRTLMDEIRQSISETLKSDTLEVGSGPHHRPEIEPALGHESEMMTKKKEDIPQVPIVDYQKQLQQQQEPQKTKPIDRDRITDILKRYSLYDDDEDDESE